MGEAKNGRWRPSSTAEPAANEGTATNPADLDFHRGRRRDLPSGDPYFDLQPVKAGTKFELRSLQLMVQSQSTLSAPSRPASSPISWC